MELSRFCVSSFLHYLHFVNGSQIEKLFVKQFYGLSDWLPFV